MTRPPRAGRGRNEDEDEADDASAPIEGRLAAGLSLRSRRRARRWYYLCTEGITHGPFSAHQMVRWAEKGELAPDLPWPATPAALRSTVRQRVAKPLLPAPRARRWPTSSARSLSLWTPRRRLLRRTPRPLLETLAVSEVEMSEADRAEEAALEAQVEKFLNLWDTGAIGRTP